jgi:hypothetical protein
MALFAAHNILTEEDDPLGFLLLRCIRGYTVVDAYLDLDLQTAETIEQGRVELETPHSLLDVRMHVQISTQLESNLQEYSTACVGTEFEKNWNFPKAHLPKHVFDDVVRKGVTRNFGTKIDESMHGPARAAYLRLTNFKDVAPQVPRKLFLGGNRFEHLQILRYVHRSTVARYIRNDLDDLDGLERDAKAAATKLAAMEDGLIEATVEAAESAPEDCEPIGNTVMGGKGEVLSFAALEAREANDPAFHHFRTKFTTFLNNYLVAFDHRSATESVIRLASGEQVADFV